MSGTKRIAPFHGAPPSGRSTLVKGSPSLKAKNCGCGGWGFGEGGLSFPEVLRPEGGAPASGCLQGAAIRRYGKAKS